MPDHIIKGFCSILAMMLLSGICNAQDSAIKKKLEQEYYLVSYDAMNDRFVVYDNAWNVGLCGPDGTVFFSPGEYEEVIVMPEYFSVRKNGKYGALDMDGRLLVDFKYKKVNKDAVSGELVAYDFDGNSHRLGVFVKSHTTSQVVDGKTVFKTEKKESDGTVWIDVNVDNIHGIELPDGTVIAPAEYDYIRYSDGGQCFIVEKNGKEGAVGKNGAVLVKPEYSDLFCNNDYFYSFVKDGVTRNTGIRLDGNADMKESAVYAVESKLFNEYHKAQLIGPWHCFIVEDQNGRKGICALDGRLLVPVRFDNVCLMDGNWFSVDRNGKNGAWSVDGRELIPADYDFVIKQQGAFYTSTNGSTFEMYLDADGKRVRPASGNSYGGLTETTVTQVSEQKSERKSFFSSLMDLVCTAAGSCYYAALTPQIAVCDNMAVPGTIYTNTTVVSSTSTSVNGYTLAGNVNAYVVTTGYGTSSASHRSVRLHTKNGNYYIHVGVPYYAALRNSQSSYFGFPVSQYAYSVTTSNATYFFNLRREKAS